MPRYGRVVLGGTFDHLHVGHEALLARAFRAGRSVAIGLTTDRYLDRHPKPGASRIAPFRARRAALGRWLRGRYPARRWTVVPLENPFGRSIEDGVDALVISADTLAGGRAVNRERRRLGRRAVPLLVVPIVLADDLGPVSSRRIRAGEIDRSGRRLTPVRIGLAVQTASDRTALIAGLRRRFPRARVQPVRSANGPTDSARAAARRGAVRAEIGVGVSGRAGTTRRIVVATPTVTLPPLRVERPTPERLASAVASAFGDGAGTNGLKRGRR